MVYHQLKQLIEASIDAYLFEDEAVLKSIHHPYSRYAVWNQYFQAKEKGWITEAEYQELHQYYDKMISSMTEAPIEKLKAQLEKCPYFEVRTPTHLYVSTPSIKSKGIQVTTFMERQGELVALSDRQCLSLEKLTETVVEYGIVYEVNKYFASH